jgi:hypothetical protein
VAENQPVNKHRMNNELSSFATRLRELILNFQSPISDGQFSELAMELFSLQFKHNPAYQKICSARDLTPQTVGNWTQIPFVPTAAFKELELSSIQPAERTAVFHSSGTTEQKPSRHYHCAESLAVYETSLSVGFFENVWKDLPMTNDDLRANGKSAIGNRQSVIFLTPPPSQAPHSSLVHMFETVRQKCGAPATAFLGKLENNGAWTLDFDGVVAAVSPSAASPEPRAIYLLGTAFSFVHLLDHLAEKDLRLTLPQISRVMETGGYKNRSRSLQKSELHALISERLGIPRENIICEYGMSELSSQAYDTPRPAPHAPRRFHFPPWSRAQIISPETGLEVADGETGIIRVLDLANVFSVAAIQAEDLGIRRGDGFELAGREQSSEPRGCSLMTAPIQSRQP